MRWLAFVLFASVAFAQIDAELAKAAKSPCDLAKFVDSHVTFDWAPAWKALGIKGEMITPSCGTNGGPRRDCNVELITVMDPFQVILRISQNIPITNTYLRFVRPSGPTGTGPWQFAGVFEAFLRYYEPRHEIVRVGERPFLRATRQGVSGSDVGTEIESWFDLTLHDFNPVFNLTTKASYSGIPDRVRFETTATVISSGSARAEEIRVVYTTRFGGEFVSQMSQDVFYTRQGNLFKFDAIRSKAAKHDVEVLTLSDEDGNGPFNEDFLRYLFSELKKIAAGPKSEQRDWLQRFLGQCDNSPEKRELLTLLKKPR